MITSMNDTGELGILGEDELKKEFTNWLKVIWVTSSSIKVYSLYDIIQINSDIYLELFEGWKEDKFTRVVGWKRKTRGCYGGI